MPDTPDSLIAAARKVADHSRIPWKRVGRFYRALQAADALPTSRGRAIWYAHPNLIAELLIALAMHTEDALSDRVTLFRTATEDASGFNAFLPALARLLTDATAAADLDHIVFEIDTGRAVIVTNGGAAAAYYHHNDGLDMPEEVTPEPLIQVRGVISGALLRSLQASIVWKPDSLPPYVTGDVDEG